MQRIPHLTGELVQQFDIACAARAEGIIIAHDDVPRAAGPHKTADELLRRQPGQAAGERQQDQLIDQAAGDQQRLFCRQRQQRRRARPHDREGMIEERERAGSHFFAHSDDRGHLQHRLMPQMHAVKRSQSDHPLPGQDLRGRNFHIISPSDCILFPFL